MATAEAITAGIKTNRQGRQVMGLVADMLRDGYNLVPTLKDDFAEGFLGPLSAPFEELREQAISRLDLANAYAQGIYARIHDDDEPFDESLRERVGVSVKQAQQVVSELSKDSDEMAESYLDEMAEIVLPVLQRIIEKVKEIPGGLSKGILLSIWPLLLLGGIVLVVMWRLRKAAT